jgi:hypothetical protein
MTRPWRYIPFVGAVAAGALFALLMPTRDVQGPDVAERPGHSAELRAAERRWRALRDSVSRHEAALERAMARERARAVALGGARATGMQRAPGVPGAAASRRVAVIADANVPPSARTAVLHVVEQELAGIGAVVPRHPVAVILTASDLPENRRSRRVIALPEAGEDPCVVVVQLSGAQVRGAAVTIATERLLATCAFYAAFGTPGAGMQGWLTETNMRSAGYLQPPASLASQPLPLEMPVEGAAGRPALAGCRAGRPAACDALFDGADRLRDGFFGPRDAEIARLAGTTGVTSIQPMSLAGRRSVVESGLLAALAADLGELRFTALWTHSHPPREAFATLEGRPLSSWTADHVTRTVEPYHAGPIPRPVPLVLGLGLLVGLSVAGVVGARKEG